MEIFKWQTWVLSGYWWKTEYKSLFLVPDSTMTLRKLRNWEKHKGSERSWETHKGSTGEGGGIKRKDRMFSFFLFFSSVPFYFILLFSLAVYFKRSFLCLYITNGSFLMYVCNIYPSVQRACKHFPFVGLFLCICSFILFWWFFFCILELCEKQEQISSVTENSWAFPKILFYDNTKNVLILYNPNFSSLNSHGKDFQNSKVAMKGR